MVALICIIFRNQHTIQETKTTYATSFLIFGFNKYVQRTLNINTESQIELKNHLGIKKAFKHCLKAFVPRVGIEPTLLRTGF